MELKDLIGLHELSGVDRTIEKLDYHYYCEDSEIIMFILDGITYKAIEDPSDGYRSYCKALTLSNDKITNTFPPQKVFGVMKSNEYYVNDIIQFIDVITNKIVLEIGTENTDDYYPCCIMQWHPENMSINIGK